MKKLYFSLYLLILSGGLCAQDYVPLLIDSLYTWTAGSGFEGDTIPTENWVAFSYDSNDILVQTRRPNSRINYSYATDTTVLVSETLDADDNWQFFRKNTKVYNEGKIISQLSERYEGNELENSAKHSYFYDALDFDTLYLLEHWGEEEWVNFYKKEKVFDENGNNLTESEYYLNSDGEFAFNRGKLFEYNNANQRVQEIRTIASLSSEPYLTGRTNYVYNDDNLLDTISRCNYSSSNNNICNNVVMATYDYSGQDSINKYNFLWDEEWIYSGKEVSWNGPEIYSNRPDSVISYLYLLDSTSHIPTTIRYLQYQNEGNNTIYFKEEEYRYSFSFDVWNIIRVKEEWYHLETPLSLEDPVNTRKQISVFPNPANSKQTLTVKRDLHNPQDLEILIFDSLGRLTAQHNLQTTNSFPTPTQVGLYTIIFRENGKLVGYAKQVVVE